MDRWAYPPERPSVDGDRLFDDEHDADDVIPGREQYARSLSHNSAFFAPHLKLVFDDLLRRKGPIMYHCSAGHDRTGATTAVVLWALGVPRDVIVEDYHLSTLFRRPAFEMPPISLAMAEANPVARMFAGYQKAPGAEKPGPLKTSDGSAYLEGSFAEIDARWGSVDNYLVSEVGLTRDQLKEIRRTFTE